MKILSRDFTLGEKVVLGVLAVFLLGLLYWYAVDSPVRTGIAQAESEQESLEIQRTALEARIAELKRMDEELESSNSYMYSYNNLNNEIDFLNSVLYGIDDYYVSFDDVTRDGDQIRRGALLRFTVKNYDKAVDILEQLSESECRCLIGDVSVQMENDEQDIHYGEISVSAELTFFETMVGGREDAGLPAETAPVEAETDETE